MGAPSLEIMSLYGRHSAASRWNYEFVGAALRGLSLEL